MRELAEEQRGCGCVRRKFSCGRDGLTIRGMEFLPEQFDEGRRYRAVIFSHGFTGNYMDMAEYCARFAQEGYAAYCFSFCGGSARDTGADLKSGGDSRDMCIASEVKDLTAVKDYVKSRGYVDGEYIALAGISQGGFVSGIAAAECREEIWKLVMICPALCIPDHARRGKLGGADYDVENVPDLIDCGRTVLGRGFHEEAARMDPFLELSPYKRPVMIVHGLEDQVVNYSYAVRAKENYEKGQCRLQLIRNAGHGFGKDHTESIMESMRQFLDGREEILTIRIIITDCRTAVEGSRKISDIYFTGYCETPYFQGTVVPEGCDTRIESAEGREEVRAEYTLAGVDSGGEKCYIHIVNQLCGREYKPCIHTNSRALGWMNEREFTAAVENGAGGPTIRIFAERNRDSLQ